MQPHIVGVVGPVASGKGVAVEMLRNRGYTVFSLSDILRESANLLRVPCTRKLMQDLGNLVREHGDSGYLAERVLEKINTSDSDRFAIDAIRNPGEIDVFRKYEGTKIIGITASPRKRFELMQIRGREGDPRTWEEFEQVAMRDLGAGESSTGQQVDACLQLADIVIENEGTRPELEHRLEQAFQNLGIEGNHLPKEQK